MSENLDHIGGYAETDAVLTVADLAGGLEPGAVADGDGAGDASHIPAALTALGWTHEGPYVLATFVDEVTGRKLYRALNRVTGSRSIATEDRSLAEQAVSDLNVHVLSGRGQGPTTGDEDDGQGEAARIGSIAMAGGPAPAGGGTAADAVEALRALRGGEPHEVHAAADAILLRFVRSLGHESVADAFMKAARKNRFGAYAQPGTEARR